jgi:hypothetical protein
MQLKIKRSQTSSMLGKVVFVLNARADLTQEEKHLVQKYKLGRTVIYDSAAKAKQLASAGAGFSSGGAGGLLKGTLSLAMSKLSLSITIDSLTGGQTIESKELDEMLGAEQAVIEGCQSLKAYLTAAATFDGREVTIDFDNHPSDIAA